MAESSLLGYVCSKWKHVMRIHTMAFFSRRLCLHRLSTVQSTHWSWEFYLWGQTPWGFYLWGQSGWHGSQKRRPSLHSKVKELIINSRSFFASGGPSESHLKQLLVITVLIYLVIHSEIIVYVPGTPLDTGNTAVKTKQRFLPHASYILERKEMIYNAC